MSASTVSIGKARSVRDMVSEAEWATRVDLAAAYRLMAHFGVFDLTYNHLSARVSDEPEHYLIKAETLLFEQVTASSLVKYDFANNKVMDSDLKAGLGGLVIHGGVMEARPDVNAVFHTHTPAVMGVSAQKGGLLPINQHAIQIYRKIAYMEYRGLEFNIDERKRIVDTLGDKSIVIMHNHGALVCERHIPRAFNRHHFLEMACQGQIAAQAGGGELILPSAEVIEFSNKQVERFEDSPPPGRDWPACVALMDSLDPSYKE